VTAWWSAGRGAGTARSGARAYPFASADELSNAGHRRRIADVALPRVCGAERGTYARRCSIAEAMRTSIERGYTDGTLPADVRRAPAHADALRASNGSAAQWCGGLRPPWQENASGGRIVAAPSTVPGVAHCDHFRESKPLGIDDRTVSSRWPQRSWRPSPRRTTQAAKVGPTGGGDGRRRLAAVGGSNAHVLLLPNSPRDPPRPGLRS
jgi:hypothetical protein